MQQQIPKPCKGATSQRAGFPFPFCAFCAFLRPSLLGFFMVQQATAHARLAAGSGVPSPPMSCVKRGGAFFCFLFKDLLFCAFPNWNRGFERFPGGFNGFGRCSTSYPRSVPQGSAHFDLFGPGRETSAPNLPIGSLPAQGRARARAVSNRLVPFVSGGSRWGLS